jgi:hypothetical protein
VTAQERAIRKASRARILADMHEAARLLSVPTATGTATGRWWDGYAVGLVAAPISESLRACIMTAWGK